MCGTAAKVAATKVPAAKVPATAEMRVAAKVSATEMVAAPMTTAMTTTVAAPMTSTMTTAASRDGIAGRRQRGHQNNDGNSDIEFPHGTPQHCCAMNARQFAETPVLRDGSLAGPCPRASAGATGCAARELVGN